MRLLYGPLLACVHATRSAWEAMVRQHSPDGTPDGFVRALQANPEGPEGEAYRCVRAVDGQMRGSLGYLLSCIWQVGVPAPIPAERRRSVVHAPSPGAPRGAAGAGCGWCCSP